MSVVCVYCVCVCVCMCVHYIPPGDPGDTHSGLTISICSVKRDLVQCQKRPSTVSKEIPPGDPGDTHSALTISICIFF